MSHRIDPIESTHGTLGVNDHAPEPIDYALDRAGDALPDQLSVQEPRPVDGPAALDYAPHVGPAPLDALDYPAHQAHAQPEALDYPAHESAGQPAPLDYAPHEGVSHPAPIDMIVDHATHADSAPPIIESAAHVGPAPLAAFDYPPMAPVEQPAFNVPFNEHPEFYDNQRRINYDGPMFHVTHWML